MDVSEFAQLHGISPRRVRAMIASGDVRATKTGRVWQIHDESRPAAHTRRPLSDTSRAALMDALNNRTLDGLTGQLRLRTARRIRMLRQSENPGKLLDDWWHGAEATGISGAANLVLHAQLGNDERVREVLHRPRERYLRRSDDLARAVRDERTIAHLSIDELAEMAGVDAEVVRRIERTGANESIGATRRVLAALQIIPTAIPCWSRDSEPR